MNVLGVGPAELLLILVVALVFVGPQRLPKLAADLARTIREIRKYTGQIAAEFNEVIEDLQRETEEDRAQWKEIGEGLGDVSRGLERDVADAQAQAQSAAAAANTPPASAPSTNGGSPAKPVSPAGSAEG
jgi:sec-independent protein translocase protein TatB